MSERIYGVRVKIEVESNKWRSDIPRLELREGETFGEFSERVARAIRRACDVSDGDEYDDE